MKYESKTFFTEYTKNDTWKYSKEYTDCVIETVRQKVH